MPTNKIKFKVGDAVYYGENEIGILTDIPDKDGNGKYRINYCQDKDLATGPLGGNGPVWQSGYPRPVTAPCDVLFVHALNEKNRIREIEKELEAARDNFKALAKARNFLSKVKN